MFGAIYSALVYNPIYNLLIALTAIVPGGDVGVAVILLTIITKLVLYPLSQKAVLAQKAMREIEPHVQKVRKEIKDPQEQFKQLQALYKEHNVNPFSSFFLLFIQIPILIGLFSVVQDIKVVQASLYSFTPIPQTLGTMFLGIMDVTKPYILLTILVVITQFILAQLMAPLPVKKEPGKELSFSEEFTRSMGTQTKYILPLFIGFISLKFASAISLYWITNNVFSIGQELYAKRMGGKVQP
ncbi:MAG: YidC/Oxa1 family membrane protein insertase [Candidatus Paceibacterota bacterium]|jgi:YidC/Oxa1 family membrane protein insertase